MVSFEFVLISTLGLLVKTFQIAFVDVEVLHVFDSLLAKILHKIHHLGPPLAPRRAVETNAQRRRRRHR
jgi:hypothetical protein